MRYRPDRIAYTGLDEEEFRPLVFFPSIIQIEEILISFKDIILFCYTKKFY